VIRRIQCSHAEGLCPYSTCLVCYVVRQGDASQQLVIHSEETAEIGVEACMSSDSA
jgi:hypothetical protein